MRLFRSAKKCGKTETGPLLMQYQSDQEQGFHLGSGVAEAACKQVVQTRLKGAGMRWSRAGAEAMLHLRAAVCSSEVIDFREAARRATFPSQA